jgi:hypothetical protein
MARVNLAISETNTGYQESGVNTQLYLAHAYRHPTYDESSRGFDGTLSDARNGVITNVHSNRSTYGADVVAVLIDDSQYCGLAYVGPSKTLMYSVTAWNCATGYYSFGHEIGHNLGLLHDRGTQNSCNDSNYNYGYRDPAGSFRTALAYSCRTGQCDNIQANGCTRINRYSNPNFQYNNKALGTSGEDNARKVNDVRKQVAKYYEHVGGQTTPTATPTASPIKVTKPTKPPTSNPNGCADQGGSPVLWGKKQKKKSCAWVNKKNKQRCGKWNTLAVCPETCKICDLCASFSLSSMR